MRGGTAIYCPTCGHRQTVGEAGEQVRLPLRAPCAGCGASLLLEKSASGGAHVTVEPAASA